MNSYDQIMVDWTFLSKPAAITDLLPYATIAIIGLAALYIRDGGPKLPSLNGRKGLELSNIARIRHWMRNSIDVLTRGRSLFPDTPYKLFSDWGELTMLPVESIDDIKSDRRFDFLESNREECHAYLPGFDGLDHDPLLPQVVTRHLTKLLSKVTSPLSEEAASVIREVATDSTDWHILNAHEDIMSIVSRMSSRVFMGQELCRDDAWNKASAHYTEKIFSTLNAVREYPRWMRPFVHWFMPSCREVRHALAAARACLQPHIERREEIKAAALARGEKSPFDDAIEWSAQVGIKRQPADCQISLSIVAIHTTSDLLSSTMLNIVQHPELFQPLREEVVRVLTAEGLKKTALSNLKLMDSVLKETQRLKPITLCWIRVAQKNVTLPNGLTIKKGQKIAVDQTHMWNEQYYDKAMEFDGYRFLRMRETPGKDHMAHLVSTSANHLGFGHGVHACPGRFFASNEVKIALCHLLLKYEWKLPDGPLPVPLAYGMSYVTNPTAKLLIRRRKEELDFSTLDC